MIADRSPVQNSALSPTNSCPISYALLPYLLRTLALSPMHFCPISYELLPYLLCTSALSPTILPYLLCTSALSPTSSCPTNSCPISYKLLPYLLQTPALSLTHSCPTSSQLLPYLPLKQYEMPSTDAESGTAGREKLDVGTPEGADAVPGTSARYAATRSAQYQTCVFLRLAQYQAKATLPSSTRTLSAHVSTTQYPSRYSAVHLIPLRSTPHATLQYCEYGAQY
eukprot:2786001-Rhodomonas_salina.1